MVEEQSIARFHMLAMFGFEMIEEVLAGEDLLINQVDPLMWSILLRKVELDEEENTHLARPLYWLY